MPMPIHFSDTEECARYVMRQLQGQLRIAAPLGLGKPHPLLNALYAQAKADPTVSIELYTALSLTRPRPAEGLERRFLEPFLRRHFGDDCVDPEYAIDQIGDALPPNVRVHEFYMQSGALLHAGTAQRDYISLNYTHVARDLAPRRLNLAVQLVAMREGPGGRGYSLSSNPDVTLDVLQKIAAAGLPRPLCIAVVHPDMPYLGGRAEVGEEFFDVVLLPPQSPPLFAPPRQPVGLAEHALGLHASSLVRDGGCLQIGIGALSDAVVQALLLRQQHNTLWRRSVGDLRGDAENDNGCKALGGEAPFVDGLYGASEMVMDGFMHLARAGILKRRSWDDLALERASAAGQLDPATPGGHYLRGGFFLGSRELYRWLHETEQADPGAIAMGPVSNVNQLYGDHQALSSLQRREARFFNTCMMATVLGEAVSDGLDDGHVVSGVGGQYNFVAMAHELPGGRSVLLLRATRQQGGRLVSTIRWNYGYCTIPRHLRDVFVTEYGVADLRGKSDRECIEAMLSICDARFIDELAEQAKRHAKLPADFVVPARWRRNTPAHLRSLLAPLSEAGLLSAFPFGSDFDAGERRLLPALGWLRQARASLRGRLGLFAATLIPGPPTAGEAEALARMGLATPRSVAEHLLARLLRVALRRTVGLE